MDKETVSSIPISIVDVKVVYCQSDHITISNSSEQWRAMERG